MFDFFSIVVTTAAMARCAEIDRGEGLKWGCITFGLCLPSLLMPFPSAGILLGCVVSFVLMTVMKKTHH